MTFKCKDLKPFADRIFAASTLEEARTIFIEMCENFDFKKKKDQYIREAKAFSGRKQKFLEWSWNCILSADGHAVLKV